MNEKNFSTHESGTSFNNGDQLDVRAGSPDLIPFDELERQRRRKAFENEALGVITSPERVPTPAERLGQLHTVNLRRRHIEKLNNGELSDAA